MLNEVQIGAKLPLRISVAIPTYNRPEYLRRAIMSVLGQEHSAYELIVIARPDDHPSLKVIQEVTQAFPDKRIVLGYVSDPGFLPPVLRAIDVANGEVLALLDDDAEAHGDWLKRIIAHYADPLVGGVGGRYINYFDGVKASYPRVKEVGLVKWSGKPIGNMYCDCTFSSPVSVDFLIGGNLSYRLDLFRQAKPSQALSSNVSFHWEIDVGLKVKRQKYKVIFDPNILVDHHSAPRAIAGMRTINYEGVYWSNFNYAYIMKQNLGFIKLFIYVLYSFLIGWGGSPGVMYVLIQVLRAEKIEWKKYIYPSFWGRLKALSHA
jgi:glycosyltransferase involved in cell wall biosynthesis